MQLAADLHTLVKTFVIESIPDLRRAAFELAVGKTKTSPFYGGAFRECKKEMGKTIASTKQGAGKGRKRTFSP